MTPGTDRAAKRITDEARTCDKHGEYHFTSYFGQVNPCPHCEDEREADALRLQQESAEREAHESALDRMNLRGRFRIATFETFSASTPKQRAVLLACREFADAFDRDQGHGLWLVGNVGTGKTHLGAAIAQAVQFQRRRGAKLMTCREIVRELRATWQRDSERSEADVIEELGNVPLLVLDEVGVGFGSDAELLQLYDVIDERYKRRRPTVVVSNLNVPAIKAAIGDRLYDRLREGATVLGCDWSSHRSVKPLGGAS